MNLHRAARAAGFVTGASGFAVGLFLLLSGSASAQGTTNGALGAASPYSEYSIGNSDRGQAASTDSEGAVAVGGNLTAGSYFVGNYSSLSTAPKALVVGGNVSGALDIQGPKTGIYAGTNTATDANGGGPVRNLNKASWSNPLPLNFNAASWALTTDSQTWGHEPTTKGATITVANGMLTLVGTNTTLDVFDVPAGDLAQVGIIQINVPVGATALVNFPDTAAGTTASPLAVDDIQYWNGSAWENGGQYNSTAVNTVKDDTLFNFPNAQTVDFSGAAITGTILAPCANFTFDNGQLDGNVYAYSVNGSFQQNYTAPFGGTPQQPCNPNPCNPNPCNPNPCNPNPCNPWNSGNPCGSGSWGSGGGSGGWGGGNDGGGCGSGGWGGGWGGGGWG